MKQKKHFRALVTLYSVRIMLFIGPLAVALSSCSERKSPDGHVGFEQTPPKPPTMAGGDTTWTQVDEMPVFHGGDTALLKYISENTTYPENAKVNNIQGRVILRFCVTSKGNVTEVTILKGVDPDLDAEAIRVVKTIPAFEPGKQAGKPVAVWYMVPITFTLK
jgi:TonB family protein